MGLLEIIRLLDDIDVLAEDALDRCAQLADKGDAAEEQAKRLAVAAAVKINSKTSQLVQGAETE